MAERCRSCYFRERDEGALLRLDTMAIRGVSGDLVKKLLKVIAWVALRAFGYLTAPVVSLVARTGYGSDEYLKRGVLPVQIHYYQPVFHADSVPASVWERKHDLPGIDFRAEAQLELLRTLAEFAGECEWPKDPDPSDPARYYWENGSFGYSSTCLLHSVVRYFKPSKVVEVGAGMSSLVMANALMANSRDGSSSAEFVTVDPYPTEAVKSMDGATRRLVPSEVQKLPLSELAPLNPRDLLFIDSSHVVRTGGDVNYLYLDVLPRLAPGVVVHIHDIHLPYEYFKSYSAQQGAPKLFWTEQYLLQALLAMSAEYEILLAGYWLQRDHSDAFARSFPNFRPDLHRPTTSFYIRRR